MTKSKLLDVLVAYVYSFFRLGDRLLSTCAKLIVNFWRHVQEAGKKSYN